LMKKLPFVNLYIFMALLLLFSAFLSTGYLYLNSPIARDTETFLFTVPRGASPVRISENLEGVALVRLGRFAYYNARFFNMSLKAGTYRLSRSMSTLDILKKIADGKQEYNRVTVSEGLSLLKTAAHLEKAGVASASEFIDAAKNLSVLSSYGLMGRTAEGFLFPDTYFFPYNSDAGYIVQIMVDTFFRKVSELKNAPDSPEELFKKVILASIIEREYRVSSEAPLISSVFSNRLKIGMGLQSCATIEYILTEIQNKPHPNRLSLDDLAIPSDYNTYLWAGLPPGPISSPGLIALEAAFNPAETHFLYFRLTDVDAGTHSFTRSLDDHVQAGKPLVLKKAAGN
jgi:UPF0755 protein